MHEINNSLKAKVNINSLNGKIKMGLLEKLINKTIHLDGDLAEVGVCGGGSLKAYHTKII
jgi:hypothetical protein